MLHPSRLTEIVDIGASPVDGPPPYQGLLDAGFCRVTGFEPQAHDLAGPNRRYLSDVVADGRKHTLHVCLYPGMTSLFEPDQAVINLFGVTERNCQVVERRPVKTKTLDGLKLSPVDYLKVDVQGAELMVFQNGRKTLRDTVVIHTEVAYLPFYKGQPTFAEIDSELRAQGFILYHAYPPKGFQMLPDTGFRVGEIGVQAIDGDAIYLRDYTRAEAMSTEQLAHMGMVCHNVYGADEVARFCAREIERRRAAAAD